jgi:hypothetical protein
MNDLMRRRFNRWQGIVWVLTILLRGAPSWGQRFDGIKPPPGLGADGRGLSGAWEAILNAEGKQWRAVWHLSHDLKEGRVSISACGGDGKSGYPPLDALAHWTNASFGAAPLQGRQLKWRVKGGYYEHPAAVTLTLTDWLTLRGEIVELEWAKGQDGAYDWRETNKRYPLVLRRLVPSVQKSTTAKVKPDEGYKRDEITLILEGRDLPLKEYTSSVEAPDALRFLDPNVRVDWTFSEFARNRMTLYLYVSWSAPPGPKAAIIMGRYFPNLFTKHPPRGEGLLEFTDEAGRPINTANLGERVRARATLHPEDAARWNAPLVVVRNTESGREVKLTLAKDTSTLFLSSPLLVDEETAQTRLTSGGEQPTFLSVLPRQTLVATAQVPGRQQPLKVSLLLRLGGDAARYLNEQQRGQWEKTLLDYQKAREQSEKCRQEMGQLQGELDKAKKDLQQTRLRSVPNVDAAFKRYKDVVKDTLAAEKRKPESAKTETVKVFYDGGTTATIQVTPEGKKAIESAEKQWRAVKEEADKIQSAMSEKEGSLQQKVNELNQQIETKRRECGEIDAKVPLLEEQLRDVERKALKGVAAAREAEQRAWAEVNQKFSQNRQAQQRLAENVAELTQTLREEQRALRALEELGVVQVKNVDLIKFTQSEESVLSIVGQQLAGERTLPGLMEAIAAAETLYKVYPIVQTIRRGYFEAESAELIKVGGRLLPDWLRDKGFANNSEEAKRLIEKMQGVVNNGMTPAKSLTDALTRLKSLKEEENKLDAEMRRLGEGR